MAQLNKAEQAIKDFISQPGGSFTSKQAEALRQVFFAFADVAEELAEDISDLDDRLDAIENPPNI